MATENLQIPDIQASQNQKEVTANAAHNLLDRAMNQNVSVAMSSGTNNMTTTQQRENFVMELTGTPGAPFTLEMADTNKRTMSVVNNTDDVCTVKNPSAGGTGQPVIAVGEASIFHFDGTDFIDFTALALTVATWIGLTDTPSVYSGESGRQPQVNDLETALEFVGTAAKRNVIAASTVPLTRATDIETGDILDGITLVEFDRVLLKDQTAGQENGIYYVQTAAPPIRVEDFDDALDMNQSPVLVPVLEGTANGGTVWIHTTTAVITVDTTPLTFVAALSPGTFLTLTDTPSDYTNAEAKEMRPNLAGNALEFAARRWRDPVRVATTASGTFATDFDDGETVDGITIATGDRILIKDQGDSDDGIYLVEASGAPTRAVDMDDNSDIAELGAVVSVVEGTANSSSLWQHTSGIDIGTDTLTFAQVGGAAANRWTEALLETTDATIESIVDIPLGTDEAVAVRGYIIGTEASSANSFAANFFAAGKNNGGSSAALASAIIDKLDGSGGGSWDFTIDVDDTGDDLRLRVTGEAATTIDWRIQYEIITEDNL